MTETGTSAAGTPQRTAPLGMAVSAVTDIRKSVLPAIAGGYGLREQFSSVGFVAGIAILAIAISAIGGIVRWLRLTYTVGPDDIRLDTGFVSRSARSVPYDRIHDVSMEQPPVARLLGLARVTFETGAGGKDELSLAWLPLSEGERLRELVRERREEALPVRGDSAAPTVEPAGEILFAMGPRRLFTFGLFEFSLAAFAVALGAAQQFDQFLPFDLWDWDGWQDRLDAPGHWLAAHGPLAQAVAVGIALATLAVVGFVTGFARTFAREWGFRLTRTAKGFRRQRGLFTRTDVVMPAHRVQAVELRTRWLRRRFGWHALKFVSLAQDAGSGSHVVAPFAQLGEIAPIAEAAGFALPGPQTDWRLPTKRAFIDAAVARGLFPLAASIGLLFSPEPLAALIPLAFVPFIALRQAFLWRRARHAIDERQIYSRRGWLAPRVDVANRVKLQSVEITQGPLARRGGYATLHLGLAGGTMAFGAVPIAEAKRIRAAILGSIVGVDFSALNSA